MKNIATRAVVVSVVLLIATFTQPAAALPRYSYSDIYYSGTWTQLDSRGGCGVPIWRTVAIHCRAVAYASRPAHWTVDSGTRFNTNVVRTK